MLNSKSTVVCVDELDKKVVFERYDFLIENYKSGYILDIGNVGGIYGGGKSYSSHLDFKEYASDSCLFGFDLYIPADSQNYTNQKQGNIEEGLPYDSNFFDTIYMGQILEHVINPGKVLYDVHRVLKGDGVLILDIPNPYGLFRVMKWLLKRKEDLGDESHLIFYTPASNKAILIKIGFDTPCVRIVVR